MDKKNKYTIVGLIFVIIIFSIGVLILNSGVKKKPLRPSGGNEFAKAVVTKVITSNVNISKEGEMEGNQTVKIKITSGKYKNRNVRHKALTPIIQEHFVKREPMLLF